MLFEPLEVVRVFLERGGDVLLAIFGVTFLMWTLMLERVWYYRAVLPAEIEGVQAEWNARSDRGSWRAMRVRTLLVSELRLKLNQSLPMIRTLVAICPLFGLLGTVTGMIEVFDVMAVSGNGNARAMAAGISKATIPTMAGMVAAISGLILSAKLDRYSRDQAQIVADHLVPIDVPSSLDSTNQPEGNG
jgi:biopolymer transport protein ExbB